MFSGIILKNNDTSVKQIRYICCSNIIHNFYHWG